jgi:ADP-ribosylglycohydrolase
LSKLRGLLHGIPREQVFDKGWEPLARLKDTIDLHPAITEVATGSFRVRQPPEIRGSGYVVKCLEAAIWAFHDATDFRQAVLRAVNLGDDADTTGAVCGQLAGAYWGESGIPMEWRRELAGQDLIERACKGLLG